VFLSNFDWVILADVPTDRISEEHQEVIRSNTHGQGCGLVMTGGPEAFGAGGWQNTPVEKALPVDSDIKLPDLLPLKGFVRTTPKPSPLVQIPIQTPPFASQEFPILAHWQCGLGKAVAFTSDAGLPGFWSSKWVEGDRGREGIFAGFWEQVIGWVLRPTESGRLQMATEYHDGKIRVTVDGKPDTWNGFAR
jgi:hypothetical protein